MSSTSVYNDLFKKMMLDIQSGEYPEGSLLPTEEQLSQKYNASRSTIRRALTLLREADLIYSARGVGSIIKPHVFLQNLGSFYSFTDTLKCSDVLIQNTVVSYSLIEADKSLSADTGYTVGTTFHKLLRLRSATEYPLMLETTYLPQSRFLSLDIDVLSQGSLYDFLKDRYGFHADHATEKFQPVMPRPEERTLLHISQDTPCMLLERWSYEDTLLIEYTKSIVRGDKYAFRVDLPRVDLNAYGQ